MQFITSGRFVPEPVNRNQPLIARAKTATPTPRRMSACLIEQGRRSVANSKENPSKDKHCRTPR